ncbi:MAG: sirohydrochlorin chelatase [Micromonosporaceae bacterium]
MPAGGAPALLLLAHGSRDARSVVATRALARAVAAARPELAVRHSFLDLSFPRTGPVLAGLAADGHRDVVAVPLLLTAAYHSRVDVPAVLAEAAVPGASVRAAGVLGPDPRLLDALVRRLAAEPAVAFDALVLAAAGSSDPRAVATVEGLAAALGERYGVPARAGFASAATPVDETVRRLRDTGAERVAVASYFLAPGLLHDRVIAAAKRAGAVAVAPPLVAVPELVDVVLDRYRAAVPATVGAAA